MSGFAVPFAFAIGSLITRQPGDAWIHTTRRWTLVTWFFQSAGIMLGAGWAYHVLGWGGYWGWDPVENASLLPWLAGTAFLHSVMMQEKKGMMKVWNIVLVSSTFFLCILGTFLTRSGVVQIGARLRPLGNRQVLRQLHGDRHRRHHLPDPGPPEVPARAKSQLESVISRESSFLFNNLILLASCFAVLWGTLFPVISEAVSGDKISLDADWYNRLMVPIGLFLLFLTGVGTAVRLAPHFGREPAPQLPVARHRHGRAGGGAVRRRHAPSLRADLFRILPVRRPHRDSGILQRLPIHRGEE